MVHNFLPVSISITTEGFVVLSTEVCSRFHIRIICLLISYFDLSTHATCPFKSILTKFLSLISYMNGTILTLR